MSKRMKRAQGLLANPALDVKRADELKKEYEEGLSSGRGRRIVVWANQLDNRVFNALWLSDWQRRNPNELDKKDAAAAKARDKQFHDKIEDKSRETVSVIQWALDKKSSDVFQGKADQVIASAFKRDSFKDKKFSLPLLDAIGRSINTPQKDVKIQLASR